MPFSPAHVVVVKPLSRFLWICPSALVIGCMIPDAEHLLHLEPKNRISHQWIGIFLYALPLGALFFVIYRRLWIYGCDALAPRWNLKSEPWSPKTVIFSLIIGAFTHLLWDSFTHVDQWGTNTFPILTQKVDTGYYGWHPYSSFLQHLSTFLGLSVLAHWLNKELLHSGKRTSLVVTLTLLAGLSVSTSLLTQPFILWDILVFAAKVFLLGCLLALSAYSWLKKNNDL